jgi:hypothetical protein
MKKRFFLFLICNWVVVSLYAMEEEKTDNSELCLESLLMSLNQFVLKQNDDRMQLETLPENQEEGIQDSYVQPKRLFDICREKVSSQKISEVDKPIYSLKSAYFLVDKFLESKSIGHINRLFSRMPSHFYPTIGYKIVKSPRFTFAQKEKMLSPLCWVHEIDKDSKRVLKLFKAYCRGSGKYAEIIHRVYFDDRERDGEALNLSWRALLDIESDAPVKFLSEQGILIIPKKIINYLLEMDRKLTLSFKKAQQILRRLDFVLQKGASIDTFINEKTSFNYVRSEMRLGSFGLNPKQKEFHAIYFKSILTLFVSHLIKRKDQDLLSKIGDENLSLEQIVDNHRRRDYKRRIKMK